MSQAFDASRSLTALEQDSTIIAVIEMSQAKWLVAGVVPGVERQPSRPRSSVQGWTHALPTARLARARATRRPMMAASSSGSTGLAT